MSNLDRESLKKLTKLCRIQCTEEETDQLLHDLQKILDYVDQLQQIDTENVAPLNHVLSGMTNVVREDSVGETLPREVFLKNAPDQIGGLIKVPPVIKKQA